MKKKTQRFEIRLTAAQSRRLARLARKAGTTKSQLITDFIDREAKLKGVR